MPPNLDPFSASRAPIEQTFSLRHGYAVLFTDEMFSLSNATLLEVMSPQRTSAPARVLVVVDQGVSTSTPALHDQIGAYFAAHAERLELVAPPVAMVGGEACKNDPALIHDLLRRLFEARMDRHSYLLVVGGGAVLDAAGYAASLFHRGMRLVRAPSTVLAQDDAGIGVKNGVNAFGVKNALGTFAPPWAVINDAAFLRTLSTRDHLAGLAEAIKVALIRDADFFGWIERNVEKLRAREPERTQQLIRRSAALHLAHIREGGDPFETGSARPLDFGHWAAHKLEVLSGHALRHGEAVAIGMALDTRYAELARLLGRADAARVHSLLERIGLPTWHASLDLVDASGTPLVLLGLEEFREHIGGGLSITLLREVGIGFEVHQIDSLTMRAAIAGAPR
jgi:3-dehydroquinate synthase